MCLTQVPVLVLRYHSTNFILQYFNNLYLSWELHKRSRTLMYRYYVVSLLAEIRTRYSGDLGNCTFSPLLPLSGGYSPPYVAFLRGLWNCGSESAFNFQEAKNVKKKLKNAWKLLIIVLKKYAKIQLKIKAEAQLSVLMGVNHSKLC